ncbi:MAG: DMT family transporter [Myxococcales bacterium]|nr:DMT family transporter [Myxococcales bacterium]
MQFFRRRPEVLLVAVAFFWGSTFIVTKDIVRAAAPLTYLTLRFAIASLVLAAIFHRALRSPREGAGRLIRDGIVLGIGQALGLILQVLGQVYTTASKAAFVTTFATALTPIIGLALYRDRPTRPQAAGVLLASIGLYFLTYPEGDAAWNRGDLYTSACAVVYGFVIVETARRARGAPIGALTTIQVASSAAVIGLLLGLSRLLLATVDPARLPEIVLLQARPLLFDGFDGKLWVQVSYMALACTVGTFLAQTWAMSRMSATHAAVVFALEPAFATGLAIAVEGGSEWPGPRGVAGAFLVLIGVGTSEWRRS